MEPKQIATVLENLARFRFVTVPGTVQRYGLPNPCPFCGVQPNVRCVDPRDPDLTAHNERVFSGGMPAELTTPPLP
jgi:hypothetical protein